jgi:hypothetical protein
MTSLWGKTQEIDFFKKSLTLTTPDQLFYLTDDGKYLAYWPKGYGGEKTTLQSRNAFIGNYTEKWTADLLNEIAGTIGGYPVHKAVCEEIALPNNSPADIAICKTQRKVQAPRDILLIIEVKMSVVWNWEYLQKPDGKFELQCKGDYKSHTGNPGLLRSDTMLKAIGKSINIRVASPESTRIPVIIMGNTPITKNYYGKVDHLKKNGIIQGFWSMNPKPSDDNKDNIKNTPHKGFYRFDTYEELKQSALDLLKEDREFFSSMQTKKRLGQIIEIANRETTYESKAQKFLQLLREDNNQ